MGEQQFSIHIHILLRECRDKKTQTGCRSISFPDARSRSESAHEQQKAFGFFAPTLIRMTLKLFSAHIECAMRCIISAFLHQSMLHKRLCNLIN